jgi:hypothetical protein
MAKAGGGGAGVFGWTLLGFLAGIAATLGVQILMGAPERTAQATTTATAGGVHITPLVSSPPVKAVKKAALAASAAPAAVPVAVQSEAEVADDAAAAGMTSRITPINEQPADRGPTVNSN